MNDVIEKPTNQFDTFDELTNRDPKDICQNALCTYDSGMNCYVLSIWGEDYGIHPQEGKKNTD